MRAVGLGVTVATSNKRARELARAKEERRRARLAAEAAKRRRQRIIAGSLVVALILALTGGFLLSTLLGADDDAPAAEAPDTTAPQVTGCTPAGEMVDEPKSYQAPGDAGLGGATAVNLTFQTNCGAIVVAADPVAAPQTVASMTFLAKDGFFDNTLCHRLTTDGIFVLQCGDPTASGSGGPGYSVPDENLPAQGDINYPAGTVAMANAGPGTAGSQFFIVYKDTTLPPNYTVWGKVTSGLEIVEQVAAAGTTDGGTDGAPSQAVMIEAVTVEPQ